MTGIGGRGEGGLQFRFQNRLHKFVPITLNYGVAKIFAIFQIIYYFLIVLGMTVGGPASPLDLRSTKYPFQGWPTYDDVKYNKFIDMLPKPIPLHEGKLFIAQRAPLCYAP